MKFALQLYSLRELAQREGGEAAVRLAAETGFDGVEFAGFYGLSPKEIAALMKKYGLEPVSTHSTMDAAENVLPYVQELGIRYYVDPYHAVEGFDDPEAFAAFVKAVDRAHALLAPLGVTLGYHNHAHEFQGGRDRVKQLLEAAPYLKAEPDVFWLHVAGLDPAEYLRGLGEKLAMVHIKEAAAENAAESPEPVVGEGVTGMEDVFAVMKERKVPWAVLEVEHFNMGEREYLTRSLENMKKLAK